LSTAVSGLTSSRWHGSRPTRAVECRARQSRSPWVQFCGTASSADSPHRCRTARPALTAPALAPCALAESRTVAQIRAEGSDQNWPRCCARKTPMRLRDWRTPDRSGPSGCCVGQPPCTAPPTDLTWPACTYPLSGLGKHRNEEDFRRRISARRRIACVCTRMTCARRSISRELSRCRSDSWRLRSHALTTARTSAAPAPTPKS
jgi:hypothetical protein